MVVPAVRTTTCDNPEQGRRRYVRNASDMNDTAENESIPDQGDRSRAFASATELVALLAQREISSRELLEIYLGRIERLNPALNAIVTLDAERALADADDADRAIARGQSRGLLHGLPMTVKDCLATAGMRMTAGAEALADYVPEHDADAVSRLRAAGAII